MAATRAAKAFVERYWADRMRKPVRPLRDPKTVLQEWAQARGLPTPSYREVERTGPHHDPVFRVAVLLPEREPARRARPLQACGRAGGGGGVAGCAKVCAPMPDTQDQGHQDQRGSERPAAASSR